jgi:uncharacterized membrane protein YkvA (DUF1232 family)
MFLVELVVALALVWAALVVLLWLLRPRDVSARELLRVVPDLVRLLRSLIADGSVPLDVRIVLVGLVVWIVNPIDLIPEFIPIVGPLDDVIVAVLALRYARRRVGSEAIRRRWPGTEDGLALVERVIGRQ